MEAPRPRRQPALGSEKERCPSCGASIYATDALCMSCGAARAPVDPPRPGTHAVGSAPLPVTVTNEQTAPALDPGPRLRWGELSSFVVARCGSAWGPLGWVFFLGWFVVPWFAFQSPAAGVIWLVMGALTVLWWNIDVNDQQVAGWQIALGLVMLTIGFLPRGGLLTLACWVIYWTRVRE